MAKREKPVCKRCNQPHWNLVPCAEVDAENERVATRDEAVAAARVHVPISRAHSRPPLVLSRNFIEQAPGVYRRRRRA